MCIQNFFLKLAIILFGERTVQDTANDSNLQGENI